jgi:hypothetical protein
MGEIADDMIKGRACQVCGQYFVDSKELDTMYEHGYPVTCWDCWNNLTKEEKKHHTKALMRTF